MKTTRLRVVLRDVEPAVAQVVDVPTSATLPELHDLLQAAGQVKAIAPPKSAQAPIVYPLPPPG